MRLLFADSNGTSNYGIQFNEVKKVKEAMLLLDPC
jgi:hypothetical protein